MAQSRKQRMTIIHENRHGHKTKWSLSGTKADLEIVETYFGEGTPVRARNPWGPKGMPEEVKRQRLIDQLLELGLVDMAHASRK